ncbi:hypothetical protein [Marinifilum caeruleilacunae]|uniref:Outer membrane protein beta-barrel domain-containing protein n=1 Tax=Marinifilum caeruleilacunae TaxID=2499076 RepID=A0ABX1WY75_9BACT|nr:hypothetical protein [Marinifilum caeruleilacunae]NOU61062.1 hypothetical protein [Marinifilum caeruleilacunae]
MKNKIKNRTTLILLLLCLSSWVYSQSEEYDFHKIIIEPDFTFKLHQYALDNSGKEFKVINKADHFFAMRITNAFFINENFSVGFGIGLEMAPVTEFPVVIDLRNYFGKGENRNYLSLNFGKAFHGYSNFKTWLGEIGGGRSFTLSKKSSLNISVNYQFTYLNSDFIRHDGRKKWVKELYTGSLALKVGIMF